MENQRVKAEPRKSHNSFVHNHPLQPIYFSILLAISFTSFQIFFLFSIPFKFYQLNFNTVYKRNH